MLDVSSAVDNDISPVVPKALPSPAYSSDSYERERAGEREGGRERGRGDGGEREGRGRGGGGGEGVVPYDLKMQWFGQNRTLPRLKDVPLILIFTIRRVMGTREGGRQRGRRQGERERRGGVLPAPTALPSCPYGCRLKGLRFTLGSKYCWWEKGKEGWKRGKQEKKRLE